MEKKVGKAGINNKNDFYIQNDLDRAGNACYTAIIGSVR